MEALLNTDICRNLRTIINKTDIFIKDEEESKKFNLICALMDRFDTAVEYINNNQTSPKTETQLFCFMLYVCVIKDGINYINNILGINSKEDRKIFEKYYRNEPISLDKSIETSDDRFFEYLRSLVFAHPFKTDRAFPSIQKGEIQYSPFTITKVWLQPDIKDPIGAMVYSNNLEDTFPIVISFNDLKEYIKNKYNELEEIVKSFKKIISDKENEWKKRKVNRSQSDIDVLKECKDILEERYLEWYDLEDLINDLECKSSIKDNETSISIYRQKISSVIPKICDAIDNYEHEKIDDAMRGVVYVIPKAHVDLHYQLEKIFGYLDGSHGDVEWGIKQAEAFSQGFAKKWVLIEPRKMSFDEIKMLVRVACYLEYIEQNKAN